MPPPCPAPTNTNLSNITAESARVSWTGNGNADKYLVNYRTAGTITWQSIENEQSNITLQNLVSCLTYEVQVLSICNDSGSEASNTLTFETTCVPCTPPLDIQSVAVTPTNATILWEQHPLALSYTLRASDAGTNDWISGDFDEIGVSYSGLESCKNYEVQLKSICADGESNFSSSHIFTTAGCNGNAYCTSQGEVADYEWIESFTIGNFTNTSGNDYGYAEFNNTNTSLETGKNYNVTLAPGFSDEPFEEYWRIWIDFNKDGDFNDGNELIFDSGNPSTSTINGNLTIPNNAQEGQTSMRVAMKWIEPNTDASLPDPCLTFGYGEVEDYIINLIKSTVAPVAAFSANTTNGTAPLSVTFFDNSSNEPTSWNWSFPEATPNTSTLKNPTVVYNNSGAFPVTLTATNSAGNNSTTISSYITVTQPVVAPVAAFSANTTNGTAPLSVTFFDNS
ncbi:MAG: GEVED domain-containing protein, partial [Chitinophagales bacterium]